MDWFFSDLSVSIDDMDAIIPHQASKTGINLFKRLYPSKENQMKESLSRYGNCIAASIPLTLCDSIEKGEIRGETFACYVGLQRDSRLVLF